MSGALTAAVIGAAVLTTGATIYASEKGAKMQRQSLQQQQAVQQEAKMSARSQQRKSEEAINAANRKKPDISAIMDQAARSAQGGPSGTMLTGPSGVDPAALSLGQSTLLGG